MPSAALISVARLSLVSAQPAANPPFMPRSIDENAGHGVPSTLRLFCHACQCGRPAPGFIQYAAYQFCNGCAAEFEVAQTWAECPTVGQFVRGKRFGEADSYALANA